MNVRLVREREKRKGGRRGNTRWLDSIKLLMYLS